jgi:hypothetical protein
LRIDNLSAGIGNPALLQGLLITRFDRRGERRSGRLHRLSAIIGTLSGLRRNPVRNASDSAPAERKAMIDRTHDLPITRQAKALNISLGSVYYLVWSKNSSEAPRPFTPLRDGDNARAHPVSRVHTGARARWSRSEGQ